uniref:cAMP-regulated phosphoprotein 19a n=1 Tax=Sinocyclocheilus rhinocerous TaxID=307959 RepID=A0A673MAL6_9TELE
MSSSVSSCSISSTASVSELSRLNQHIYCAIIYSCQQVLLNCLLSQPKYFDSGDYNMAKAKIKNKQLPAAQTEKTEITGDHIPTPQDLPQRKPSLVASKLAG